VKLLPGRWIGTHTTYVLIREKVYARIEALLGDEQGDQSP